MSSCTLSGSCSLTMSVHNWRTRLMVYKNTPPFIVLHGGTAGNTGDHVWALRH